MHAISWARPDHLPRVRCLARGTLRQIGREVGRAAAALAAALAWGAALLLLAG